MATLREYFDTDPRAFTLLNVWTFRDDTGALLAEVPAKIAYDFEANAKYWYFYIPEVADLSQCLAAVFNFPGFSSCQFGNVGLNVQFSDQSSETRSTSSLRFTKRIHLYVDSEIKPKNKACLSG